MNEVNVRIFPARNRWINADKDDFHFEIIPPDAVSTDIQIDLVSNKCEYKRYDAKGLREVRTHLENEI